MPALRALRALLVLALLGQATTLAAPAPARAQSPTATPGSPLAQGAPAGIPAPVFAERFVDNEARWPVDGRRFFSPDGYHLVGEARETRGVFPTQPAGTPRVADLVLEAELRKVDGPDDRPYGVAVRSSAAPRQGYMLLISSAGRFSLDRIVGEEVRSLVPQRRSLALRLGGEANVIRLAARGSALSVSINGQQEAFVEDEAIPDAGAVQLLVGDGVHVVARSLTVTEATARDVVPLPAPALLFQDLFFDNRERWPMGDARYIAEDGYHLINEPRDPPIVTLSAPANLPPVADLAVEAELHQEAGSESRGFGIGIRAAGSPLRSYQLLINDEGAFGLFRSDGEDSRALVSWRRSPALLTGSAINVIRLVARGDSLAVFLNGQVAARVRDEAPLEAGGIRLIVPSGAHVVVRSVSASAPTEAELNPRAVAASPLCLPAVEHVGIEPSGVRARVRNPCAAPLTAGLAFVLLDQPGGQPVGITGTVRWDAPPDDAREVHVPATTAGAGAAVAQLSRGPANSETARPEERLRCEAVGAASCLLVDPWLAGAVRVLGEQERGRALLKVAAESGAAGVVITRSKLPEGLRGVFLQGRTDERFVYLDERLDAYSDWERAVILAHELQHAADAIAGLPYSPAEECVRREEVAFVLAAEVWNALWRGRLPAARNEAQEELNRLTRTVTTDPVAFAQSLPARYRHQCG